MKKEIHYLDMPMNEYYDFDLENFSVRQLEDYYYDNPDDNDEKMAIINGYGEEPR